MGMLTPVLIRNDDLGEIEDDKSFIKRLVYACLLTKKQSISALGCCNAVECMGTKHADVSRLLVVRGNTMMELNPYSDKDVSEFELECAKFAKKEANEIIKKYKKRVVK